MMLEFSKYHGTGNDFVMIEDLGDEIVIAPALVAALCDRRFGVGADGLIRVTRDQNADFFMDYYNADGSVAEMCGNGIRCLGLFVRDRDLSRKSELDVASRGGLKHLVMHEEAGSIVAVTVDMGEPAFAKSAIPMQGPGATFLMQPVQAGGRSFNGSAVSMGNPHLVLFVEEDLAGFPVHAIGAELESHEMFPEKTNVEFVHLSGSGLETRVWERGVGETMACGTGACAVLVAANEAGLTGSRAPVLFPGGALDVERTPEGPVLLTGPAEWVFDGRIAAGWMEDKESK